MIIITGATGALNGATVDHLLERMPASEIVVVTSAIRPGPNTSRIAASECGAATTPTPARCRLRSRAPTNCCWCPRTTRAPTR